ncbi:MAG: hypothetical protein ACHQ0Y_08890 [Thermodesulfovibrionales bacterium]
MRRLRLILKFIFFFPGTFLHELSHYCAALVLGKAEGFSVWPRIEGGNFVFGSVKSRTRYKVLSSFIAAAPVIWWVVLVLTLRYLHFIGTLNGIPSINFGMISMKLKSFTSSDTFFIWLFLQILWAGRPSLQDVKNFIRGVFSVSGIMLLSVVAGLIYLLLRVSK